MLAVQYDTLQLYRYIPKQYSGKNRFLVWDT